MKIGEWDSDSGEVYVVAEAGINHCGQSTLAIRLIDAAKEAGANAVKFQWFDPDALVARRGPSAAALRPLALDPDVFATLKIHCDQIGIDFLCSVFDIPSADAYLELDPPAVKIGSGELRELALIGHIAHRSDVPIILSTGMATMHDVGQAVLALKGRERALLHCVSAYPTPLEQVNLRAMDALKAFHCPVGFSDHCVSATAGVLAVARGACIIERHLTLDRTLPGPDHVASTEPGMFQDYVRMIRCATAALGHGRKEVLEVEHETMRKIGRL